MKSASPLALAAAALLSGCAAPGPFPSLAPREAERVYAAGDPLQVLPEAPDRAGLAGQVAAFAAAAGAGESAFNTAIAAARPLVSRAGGSGSESWVAAQEAVSRVEAARAATSKAAADLDQFAAAEAQKGPVSTADYQLLTEALVRIGGVANRQQEAVDRLRTSLSGG